MVEIDKEYVFDGSDGKASLLDLFGDRRQLLVHHFMFDPSWDEWPVEAPGVSAFLRVGDRVFHTYSTYTRGTELLVGTYNWLDLTALGAAGGLGAATGP